MTFNLYKQFKTDENLEEQGIWVDFEGGVSIRIRRLSSQASVDARSEASKPYTTQIRRGALPDEVAEKIAIQQLARGVVADWKGIQKRLEDEAGKPVLDEDGKVQWVDIPYTAEAAVEILSDENLEEFRGEIFQIAMNRDAFKSQDDDEALGN